MSPSSVMAESESEAAASARLKGAEARSWRHLLCRECRCRSWRRVRCEQHLVFAWRKNYGDARMVTSSFAARADRGDTG